MILGSGETCTGDAARRLGQEFLFHELAKQNVETLNSVGAKKIVVTCAHCFNTIANEYPQLGGHYEVVHHTELLARLIKDGRIRPVGEVDAAVTYHDPCYLGRHNRVFDPPRAILESVPGVRLTEMAAQPRALVLLRRRRRADVDGGDDRLADQRDPDRRGAGHGAGPGDRRVPVLHRDADRRGRDAEAAGEGRGVGAGGRRVGGAAALGAGWWAASVAAVAAAARRARQARRARRVVPARAPRRRPEADSGKQPGAARAAACGTR